MRLKLRVIENPMWADDGPVESVAVITRGPSEGQLRAELTRDAFLYGGFRQAWLVRMQQDFVSLHRARFEDGKTVQQYLDELCG